MVLASDELAADAAWRRRECPAAARVTKARADKVATIVKSAMTREYQPSTRQKRHKFLHLAGMYLRARACVWVLHISLRPIGRIETVIRARADKVATKVKSAVTTEYLPSTRQKRHEFLRLAGMYVRARARVCVFCTSR